MTKDELDKKFGNGGWRFIPRFILHQRLKDRLSGDTKRGGHNDMAISKEAFFTANVDFAGEVLATVIAELAWKETGLRDDVSTEEVLNAIPYGSNP